MNRRCWLLLASVLMCLAVPSSLLGQTGFRYVHPTDPTCGGHSPCYATIQAAVNAATSGEHVVLQAGTYVQQVNITGKNNTANASEADRIVIEADPSAAPGSVVLDGAVNQCTNGHAIRLQQSKFITIRGLTITGAGGQAISLLGGNNQNQAIHLERLRIFGNGNSSCDGGITIARGNPGTLILNSLIYNNGRNGFATIDADGGPHYLIGNTIHGNQWSGVSVTRTHEVFLVNNAITGNGVATGSTGGRFGVSRESSTSPQPAGIHLLNNLICGNRLGEINGPALDATDSGNLTPTGTEGPGVTASPGCDVTASVYADLDGGDGLLGSGDDDFRLAIGSAALDHGMDPRTLGLAAAFNPLLETDFTGAAGVRPQNATGAPTARFDIGAFEANPADGAAPVVSISAPPANAHVRGSVSVQAQATDAGSGVASLTLRIDTQPLTATLTPALPPPAPSVTATATWNTTSFGDGAHTLTAEAQDAAGNPASASRVLIADNTPPETSITGGPSGEIATASASFSFTGTDNLTPAGSLQFAWRLDGAAWSVFSTALTASLSGLGEGAHTFEVKARDLAGNEDPTPAARSFTVRLGPTITSVDPTSGPVGTFVTITGTNFEPGSTTVSFNGRPAVLRTVTATQITTTVPPGATTGPLVVGTSHGAPAVASFTVTLTGEFALSATPGTVRAIAGDRTAVAITATGSGAFTSLVSLSVNAPPTDITAAFDAAFVAPGGSRTLTLTVPATVAAGNYAFTIVGAATIDGQAVSHTAPVTLDVLPAGTTAVTGQVLTAEAVPVGIRNVTITLGSAFTQSDDAGNFTLLAPPPGPNMMLVDGRTASTPTAQYPPVEIQVDVAATGPTRIPFPLYLPRLDTSHPITLPLDANGFTQQEVLATTPLIPGLVVTIPQGTKITGPDGNAVQQITITPVPIDRSPMPFPAGHRVPMLFTIQPGGAIPSQPLPITFPNPTGAAPGSIAQLYYFDLGIGNWASWGTGTVSDDGTQIVSDPGAGLPRFAWHYPFCGGGNTPPTSASGADPVDLFTGQLTVSKTDFVLPGRIPVSIQRRYRSGSTQAGLLGPGWTLAPYDTVLTTAGGGRLELINPDQSSSYFSPVGVGQWANTDQPSLRGAVITQLLSGEFEFEINFKDGVVHRYSRIIGFANAAGLSAITDRNGNTVTITRISFGVGQFGRITQITGPAGRSLGLTYTDQGLLDTVTDPIGRTVSYTYDVLGRLETVTNSAGGVTSYTYDTNHRLLTVTDPRGITFIMNEYDAEGRVIRQTQADGGVWRMAYETNGTFTTQTTLTTPRGHARVYRFSPQGFVLAETDALGQATVNTYAQGSNLLLATTDPLGRITRYAYDSAGNVTTVIDPAGNPRTFTYEPTFNRIASITDPLNHTTSFEYDARGNLTAIIDPLSHRTTLTYNDTGQPASVTDPLSNTTTFTYNTVGDLVAIADPLGNTTQRVYDAVSRSTQQLDGLGQPTTFAYDPLNRTTQILGALGGLTQFSYDANGNVLTVTDARNSVTSYTYDSMDRLQTRTDPVGATESFEFDLGGNSVRHVDRKGQVATFTYDALDRRTVATYADSTTVFRYDGVGRLIEATDSLGGTAERAYDLIDRLFAETGPLGTIQYQFDGAGRRTAMIPPAQAPVSYIYDGASRLTSLTQGSQVVSIEYDDASRRTRLTLPNQVSTEYQYDAASRLISLIYRNAAAQFGDLTYGYDATGNRTRIGGSYARLLLPDPVETASYDAANRQMTFGGLTFSFDANGNLASDDSTTYTRDARNRLVVLAGPTPGSFQYDPLGRRTTKSISNTTTRFQYDGLNPILEVTDGGQPTALLTSLGIDEYLMRTNAEGQRSFLTDALGSTLALTDEGGTVVVSYSYEPFGRTEITGAPPSNAFQYTGRENDGDSIYYYRTRYYHPELHRFVSSDPMGIGGGDTNLYAYVRNRPTRFVDPLGLQQRPAILLPTDPVLGPPDARECIPRCKDLNDDLREALTLSEQTRRDLKEAGKSLLEFLIGVGCLLAKTECPQVITPTLPQDSTGALLPQQLPPFHVSPDLSGRKD